MAFMHGELSTPTASTQHTRNSFLLHSNNFPLIVLTHQLIHQNQLREMTVMMTVMTYLQMKIFHHKNNSEDLSAIMMMPKVEL